MYDCPVNHPDLPQLFDPTVPDNPALWAVFEGRHAGRAVVDDVEHPAHCVVRTEAVLTFSSRRVKPTFLSEAIAHVGKFGAIWLVWPEADATPAGLPEADRITQRLEFYDCDVGSQALVDLRARLPEGCEMCAIDRLLLERCEWREDMIFFCGSVDNFLLNGMGLCLMRGGEILVEAYVSSFGGKQAEIGAVTRADYRGKGYAPIACAYLIQACHERGYQAYWSCEADNTASIRVAEKLGFYQRKSYQVLEYHGL